MQLTLGSPVLVAMSNDPSLIKRNETVHAPLQRDENLFSGCTSARCFEKNTTVALDDFFRGSACTNLTLKSKVQSHLTCDPPLAIMPIIKALPAALGGTNKPSLILSSHEIGGSQVDQAVWLMTFENGITFKITISHEHDAVFSIEIMGLLVLFVLSVLVLAWVFRWAGAW